MNCMQAALCETQSGDLEKAAPCWWASCLDAFMSAAFSQAWYPGLESKKVFAQSCLTIVQGGGGRRWIGGTGGKGPKGT